jgi:hypothetical protein
MPNVTSTSALPVHLPAQRQPQFATSASEVARAYAEHSTKKVLSALHIPEKLTDTASVVSLQDSNLRAQKLSMKAEAGDGGGLYMARVESDNGSLVLSTKDSDKKLELLRLPSARQEDSQCAPRRATQAQVLAACEAYRVMQRSDIQTPLSRKGGLTSGGIISTTA